MDLGFNPAGQYAKTSRGWIDVEQGAKSMTVARLFSILCVAMIALAAMPAPVEAGTPYTCLCEGKKKRFIGTTYFCGHRKPKCTSKEYRSFREQGCAESKCTVPR